MKTMGIYGAKTHFSEIIDKVFDGETIIISRYGSPVARIVPELTDRAALTKPIDEWFEFRNKAGYTL